MCIDLSEDYADRASKDSKAYNYAYEHYMGRCMTREYKTVESHWNLEFQFKSFNQVVNFI